MESLKEYETYVDNTILFFISKLKEMQWQDIDMGLWVHLFAFGMFAFAPNVVFYDLRLKRLRHYR